MKRVLVLLALCLSLAGLPVMAVAVQPDEVLADPGQEIRAREIGKVLRCPVCQGENIDESNAPVSRDLRLYVRERITAGDTDDEVIAAVVNRFGEFVLFEPPASGSNLVLWLAGPVMVLIGLLLAWRFLRTRSEARVETPLALTRDERDRLDQIMRG